MTAVSIVCPACGKKNDGGAECLRCGCELAVLQTIIDAADAALRRGEESLARGDAAAAIDQAETSWRLKKSQQAARLAFLANIAIGDDREAGRWYALAGDETKNVVCSP